MRLNKRMRAKTSVSSKSTRSRKSTRSNIFAGFRGTLGTGAIVVVVISVVAAAMLMAARESSQPADVADVNLDAQQQTVAAQAKKPAAAAVPANALAANTTAADASDADSAANSPAKKPATIGGCLVREDKAFRLTDTTGADAPKSRRWKSGFLKRGSASVELVDATKAAKLRDHVGQRVSVTGMLADRQMQVRSLRRVAASCG